MRRVYLVARREYLSYVTAWGFWLSLLMVPMFMSIGLLAPVLAERAAPTRYYAVIADSAELDAAFEAGLTRASREALEAMVRDAAQRRGADDATRARALAAYRDAETGEEGLDAAAEVLGLPSGATIRTREFKYERVGAPSTDPDALRPYLLGEATVATPEGPKPLHAALFLGRDADGTVRVDYWSAALTDSTLLNVVETTMRDVMRADALAAAGVSVDAVDRADALTPRLTEYNPERAAADAEVTLSDRLPIVVGVGMGAVLWMVVFSVVNILLTGVIEEKGAKILEALLASARYHEILAGKLLGVAAVSATLLGVWGGSALIVFTALANAGAPVPDGLLGTLFDPGLLIPFVLYFVLGYLMYGAIFLAIGSLCETIQEAQTLMTPMMFVIMGPMLLAPVVIRAPDAPIATVMSWAPLYTPFLMMVRLPSGPPLYEVVGTSIVLAASTVLILWAAGGVFRAGVVGGARPGALKAMIGRGFARMTRRA